MKGFKGNIEEETLNKDNFRKVLYTSGHLQLVLMSLKPEKTLVKKLIRIMIGFSGLKAGLGSVQLMRIIIT